MPTCELARIYDLCALPYEAARALTRAEVDAILADRAPIDSVGAAALPIVTGSVRGYDLIEVAVLARGVL